MSKITKRIKKRQEESRKKKSNGKESIVVAESTTEDIETPETDQLKDVLKESFVNLKASMRQSVGSYGNQSVTPISVSPSTSISESILPEQEDPAALEQKKAATPVKSKTKTLIKNVGSILKDRLGETTLGQFVSMSKDLTSQFKDLFKTQEEIFAERVIEEAKMKKKEAERLENEKKLKEDILRREGLLIEKKEEQQEKPVKVSVEKKEEQQEKPVKVSVEKKEEQSQRNSVSLQVADDVQKIRTLMEVQAQQSAHSMEEAVEKSKQDAEVVKTLKDIEKNLEKPQVTKEVKKDDGLMSMLSGLTSLGNVFGKIGPILAGLGPIFAGLSTAILPLTSILGVVGGGLFAFNKWIDSRASENRGTEQWKEKASPEELKKWDEEVAVYDKALHESQARKIEKAEFEKVHRWDSSNLSLEKIGSESRIVNGKITKNWVKNDDGTYSTKDVEKVPESVIPVLKEQTNEDSRKIEQSSTIDMKSNVSAVELQKSPNNLTTKLTEDMTDSYNRSQLERESKQSKQNPIVIQQPAPVSNETSKPITLFDSRRNSDSTFQRLNDRMFTGSFI